MDINHLEDYQMFQIGQKVIAINALPGSNIKNGTIYTVYSFETDKGQDGKLYWYIGVENDTYTSHNRVKPSIFAPIIDDEAIQAENEQFIINWNTMWEIRQLNKKLKRINTI